MSTKNLTLPSNPSKINSTYISERNLNSLNPNENSAMNSNKVIIKNSTEGIKNGWGELIEEQQQVDFARGELQRWQDKLNCQGNEIDKRFEELLEREKILHENTKVYEEEYVILVKQENVLKEKD